MNNTDFNGALLCARYAFAPNLYHYCGPDTHGELGERVRTQAADEGLVEDLCKFETLYPYLVGIAEANNINDPFDVKVVEAYWVGNGLLDKVTEQQMFTTLTNKQQLHKRLSKYELKWLLPNIDKRARLHHSFHVF